MCRHLGSGMVIHPTPLPCPLTSKHQWLAPGCTNCSPSTRSAWPHLRCDTPPVPRKHKKKHKKKTWKQKKETTKTKKELLTCSSSCSFWPSAVEPNPGPSPSACASCGPDTPRPPAASMAFRSEVRVSCGLAPPVQGNHQSIIGLLDPACSDMQGGCCSIVATLCPAGSKKMQTLNIPFLLIFIPLFKNSPVELRPLLRHAAAPVLLPPPPLLFPP